MSPEIAESPPKSKCSAPGALDQVATGPEFRLRHDVVRSQRSQLGLERVQVLAVPHHIDRSDDKESRLNWMLVYGAAFANLSIRDEIDSNLYAPRIQGCQENALIRSFKMGPHLMSLR